MANEIRFNLPMDGDGFIQKEIATGYKFITVMNNTDNRIEVYDATIVTADPAGAFISVPAYQAITYPLKNSVQYTFFWYNGGGTTAKKAEIIFSSENLNINTALGGNGSVTTVTLQTDSVGIAKSNQFPTTLSGTGRLKVELPNDTPVTISQIVEVEVKNDAGNPLSMYMSNSIPAGTNNIGDVDVLTLPAISLAGSTNNIGDVDVLTLPAISLAGSTNNIGDVDVLTLPSLATGTNTIGNVVPAAGTTQGADLFRRVSDATTNAAVIKASAGQMYSMILTNNTGGGRLYFKFYNKATTPTVGTDVPVITIMVPSGWAIEHTFPVGVKFSAGIGMAITGALPDADTSVIAVNDAVVVCTYK